MPLIYSTQGGTNQWDVVAEEVEVVTEVVEAISITEAVEVVDTLAVVGAPARIIAQCTELLTTDQ